MSEAIEPDAAARSEEPARPGWRARARLPVPTLVVLGAFAAALWINALINHFRFNVVLALLASVPAAFVVIRCALIARAAPAH
jgi:hypothetical protein